MLSKNEIIKIFTAANIKKGDIVCIQGSYKGMGGIIGGPSVLATALFELIGQEGTLLMPAYNLHSWTENHYFNIQETVSEVGVLTDSFRKMSNVKRTKHPIHSLSVWGKWQNSLCEMEYKNSFGANSVFAKLLELNCIYMTIGLGNEMPFLPCHLAEKEKETPYRLLKDFSGTYINYNGVSELKTYNFDVRKEEFRNKTAPVFPIHKVLCHQKVVKKVDYNNVSCWFSNAKDYHQGFLKLIEENRKMFGWEK